MPSTFTVVARGEGGEAAANTALPESLRAPFAEAMSQSMLLPAFTALFGLVGALFLVGFQRPQHTSRLVQLPERSY
jgi:hypothetical protein